MMGSKIEKEETAPQTSRRGEFLPGLDISELEVGNMYRVYVRRPNSSDLREGAIVINSISVETNTVDGDFQFYGGKKDNPIISTRLSLSEYSLFPMYGN
jgi:hypothetical protein